MGSQISERDGSARTNGTRRSRKLQAITLVGATAFALALPAGAGGAAPDRPILHTYSPGWKGEICVVDATSKERRCLTDNYRFDYDAVWSPDGSRVAFVQQTNNPRNADVYVMNADGTGTKRLTTSPRDDDSPRWSPDGTQIVWSKNSGDSPTGRLKVMNADGTEPYLLTGSERDDTWPRWSPNGEQILFNSRNPCTDEQLCTLTQFDVHVVDADGSDERNLTRSENDEYTPVWSPDGSRIAFTREVGEEDAEIFVMDADGSEVTQVTDTPGANFIPSWSPDGSQIAFTQITHIENFNTRLGVVDVDTGEVRILTTEEVGGVTPTWSPEGDYIAFTGHRTMRDRTASYELHAIRPDGTDLRRLTRTTGEEHQPHWSGF